MKGKERGEEIRGERKGIGERDEGREGGREGDSEKCEA